MQQEILDAIRQTASIPSMPQAAARFMELSASEEPEFDDLVDLLCTDPGAAGDILRLANSSLFGVHKKIGSLKQAMILLGLSKIRNLIIGRMLVQQMDTLSAASATLDLPHYWTRSLTCAILTARFCEACNLDLQEEGFVSGLLADVGVVVLDCALPHKYKLIARDYGLIHADLWVAREQHAIAADHAAVSAIVLQDWNLPQAIVEGVRLHHSDIPLVYDADPELQIASLLGVASDIAQVICDVPCAPPVAEICATASQKTGLRSEVVINVLLSIEEAIDDLASLLRLKLIRRKTFELFSEQLADAIAPEY